MYKETLKSKNSSLVSIVAVVTVFLLLFVLIDIYPNDSYKWIFELIVFIAATIAIYMLLTIFVGQVTYTLIDNTLKFQKGFAEKINYTLEINLKDIVEIFDNNSKITQKYVVVPYTKKICRSNFTKNYQILIYKSNNIQRKISFEPSEKLLNLINEKSSQIVKTLQ